MAISSVSVAATPPQLPSQQSSAKQATSSPEASDKTEAVKSSSSDSASTQEAAKPAPNVLSQSGTHHSKKKHLAPHGQPGHQINKSA
jgi:hypothetical protein